MSVANPVFTKDYSGNLSAYLNKSRFRTFSDIPMNCLEIGSFEGRGSLLIVDKLCRSPESKLYCVDPWDDCYVKDFEPFTNRNSQFVGQYERFMKNINENPKIIPLRGKSSEMVPTLKDNSFDFVFIDGDHSPEGVYLDATLCFPKVKAGGRILFDDYKWELNGYKCGDGIDKFLKIYESQIKVLYKDLAVCIEKL